MLFTKNIRSFALVVIVATVVLMASTPAEAVPTTPDAIACRICDEPPECPECPDGFYCSSNYCTCRAVCKRGVLP
ncbi:hypothetical protein EC991_008796 [Linnemannia zychae]|nr:hypothetical protein EC991_008796 [Linnemannia zychae]